MMLRTRILPLFVTFLASLAVLAFGPDDKAPAPIPTKVELHRLSNDLLLKQAKAIHDKASQDYLAAVRGLAAAELLLDKATSEAIPQPADEQTENKAKAVLIAAQNKAQAARKNLAAVQHRKTLLDRVSAGSDSAQSASAAFLNALDDLEPFLIELKLRTEDGSLAADKVPSELASEALAKRRKSIAAEQERRKEKVGEIQKKQALLTRQLDEANKTVLAAEAEVTQAGNALAQEQKRQEIEKTYAGKKPDALLAEMTRLLEEGDGLKGTYELALAEFNTQAGEVARLRKALEQLTPPTVKIPQIARAEDVEIAAKAIGQFISFHTRRARAITELQAVLTGLLKQGGEFEADATVSYNHLFEMNVIAGLLVKAGVAEEKFPDGTQPNRLATATEKQAKSAAEVQAATEKARSELVALAKQLTEVSQAQEAANKQLAGLKQSQETTKAALRWQEQLRTRTAAQVTDLFNSTRRDLTTKQKAFEATAESYRKAKAAVTEARSKLAALKDPFLRQAEEQKQSERLKLLGELRKEAGLERATSKDTPSTAIANNKKPDTTPSGDKADKKEPDKSLPLPPPPPPPDKRTEIEKTADRLAAFQQVLAARTRVQDERQEKAKELLAALDGLEKKASEYKTALGEARQQALQLTAAGADLKKRVGKGELAAGKIPEGVTEALRGKLQADLDSQEAAVLAALMQIEAEREQLQRPDDQSNGLEVVTKELLALVDARLDLLTDLKKLIADYQREKKDRPQAETMRIDQLANERRSDGATTFEMLLGIDTSTAAKGLEELLMAYYRELVEIEEKADNLKKQKEKVEELIELSRKETSILARILPLLEARIAQVQGTQEEERVLARCRLQPELADEFLKAHQARTDKLLARPVPIPDKEKAAKVDEMATALFDRLARLEAMKRWGEVLAARLASSGLKAEAGVYQDEIVRVNATVATNARRITALTGVDEGTRGGEIGKVRQDLIRVRTGGVKAIAFKLAGILLAALLLPWLFAWTVRRLSGGEDSGLVVSALRAFFKIGVWVVAFALGMSVLGFDVTAILAGLGIGGLAVGLAAQSLISDVIAALVIFAERRFKINDVIKVGGNEPARVIGLNWRSTQLRDANGLVINVPNQKILNRNIQNLTTRTGQTSDSLTVTVTTERDVGVVLAAIRKALAGESLVAENGVAIQEFTRRGEVKVVTYRLSWLLNDYESRNKTREQVFARISETLAREKDLEGTEVTLV